MGTEGDSEVASTGKPHGSGWTGEALSVYTCGMSFRAHAHLGAASAAETRNNATFLYHPPGGPGMGLRGA